MILSYHNMVTPGNTTIPIPKPNLQMTNHTKPNPINNKPYRPPPARNEHVIAVFTQSGLTYDPPVNPNIKITVINDDSEDEVDKAKKEAELTLSEQTKSDPPPLKVPPKLGEPGSFLIPCTLANSVECLALADLGARINLMPYSLYTSLFENTLKPKRMNIRLANYTYQYPMGVADNMLVQVGKFVFLVDFVILQMEEDDKVPLI
ncbi:reverse transcriptase domain-containing protein [Tanacetum coccineum]